VVSVWRTLISSFLLAAGMWAVGAVDADEPADTLQNPTETFTPPKATSIKDPRYPGINRRIGREGWVYLTFMVSPTGEPYDVAIIDSSGDERFEAAAIDAVEQWTFEPATLGERPIDAAMFYLMTFALSEDATASPGFVRMFRDLLSHIEAGDRSAADGDLADLRGTERNLYEEANLNLATFHYAQKWGTPAEQYPPLRRATVMRDGKGFLPDDVLTSLLKNRFALELELNHLADARSTGKTLLKREADQQIQTRIDQALARIDALETGDQPVLVAGRIGDSSHYVYRLLRNRFHLQDIDGNVAELRLHCERDYVGFTFRSDLAYTISEALGPCTLMVLGTPGTTFTLVET